MRDDAICHARGQEFGAVYEVEIGDGWAPLLYYAHFAGRGKTLSWCGGTGELTHAKRGALKHALAAERVFPDQDHMTHISMWMSLAGVR